MVRLPSTLEEWLDHQARQHPRTIDLGLTRLFEVLARLGWRRPPVPVITIAGTNGKGSVAATCAAILTAAGYAVGSFTSPHLRDYRERIRIRGMLADTAALMRAFARIEAARGPVALTFFEYNTLAALLMFEAARLDVWVLEVGMGGRLDAVNVIDADVAVVVSIGLDHTEYLGATLEAIGREKAGVFRQGRPAVLGSRNLPPVVAETARMVGAACKRLGHEFDVVRSSAAAASWAYRGPLWHLDDLPAPRLRGDVQYDNAATALAALEELAARLPVSAAQVAAGLESVQLIGRFQVIVRPGAPSFILDVAHNPDAARVLAANLGALPAAGRSFAVCGILADKDAPAIVAALRACIDAWWFVPTTGDRGRSARALADSVAGALAAPATECPDLPAGCAAALAAASSADRIVVFGSFHVVGPALDWLEAQGWLDAQRWHEAQQWRAC